VDLLAHLPYVLLGLSAAPREDSGVSVAELLYGAPLSLPCIYNSKLLYTSCTWHLRSVFNSVAEPEPEPKPHHFGGTGAVMRCGSGSNHGV
jgi:hypothetical protein